VAVQNGTDGNDQFFGMVGENDRFSGGLGDDFMQGFDGSDRLLGGPGNDEIWDGEGMDRVSGGTGNDTIVNEPGIDEISSGDGRDIIVFLPRSGLDTIQDFDPGQDTIEIRGYTNILSFRDLSAFIELDETGDNTLINLSAADGTAAATGNDAVIVLLGVDEVSAGDFDFS
jgi:Ca2+-binding RTX toxin-like protein